MTDRVYPSSKPITTATNNNNTTTPIPTTTTPATAATTKPQQQQPRYPYRPQPQYGNHHRRLSRRRRINCCCCCFWSLLVLLALALLLAIAGSALYVLYHPQNPHFSINSLRIAKLNLTAATSDSSPSAAHLNSLLNLTLTSKNPNSHIVFFYEPFTLTAFSTSSVQLANGSIPAFVSNKNNETSFRAILTESKDLDTDSATSLRSDLKRKNGVPMKVQMDTEVKVKMGGLNSKKVGIRVTCQTIKGVAPKSKTPSVASVVDAKCKVDLRIKIWKFTF